MSASGGIPGFVRGNQAPTTARKATVLSIGVRTGCAARLANLAKRVECGQLAGAFGPPTASQSGSKLHALHALRDMRLRLCPYASGLDTAQFGQELVIIFPIHSLFVEGVEDERKLKPLID